MMVFDVINKLCLLCGIIVILDNKGGILLMWVSEEKVNYILLEGVNIIEVSVIYDGS